jgi:hypothetical protein
MTQIIHPLPVGTILKVNTRSWDSGVMSWDDTDTEIERVAEAGSECHVWQIENSNDGTRYHVTFIPSEVWNILEEKDFSDHPEHFGIVSLGDGTMSSTYTGYFDNEDRPRDPEAERKIAEELGNDGPNL